MDFAANCHTGTITLSPFGALMDPESTDRKQLLVLDKDDKDFWMMLTRSGVPVPHNDHGESSLQRWCWYDAREPLELHGLWIVDDALTEGLRARACYANILITDSTFRIGLTRARPAGGPWVNMVKQQSGHRNKEILSEVKHSGVYGGCFKLSDITWVRGNRRGIAFGTRTSALTIARGHFSRRQGQVNEFVDTPAPQLVADLLHALIDDAYKGTSNERIAAVENLARRDLESEFGGFGDALLEIPE